MQHFLIASIVVLFFFQSVSAHNWLTSPARGNKNNNFNGFTSPPCPAKGTRVHAQVGAGQRFPIEWASGHGYGSYTFLVVMKASDETEMIKNNFELLNDYIANAPPSALNYMSDSKAVHVSHDGQSGVGDASLDQDITKSWSRPSVFRTFPNAKVFTKKSTAVANDRRVRYNSAKYPWIISVHKFALNEDRPEDMDSVMMEIPADAPSGQYVIQYLWNGYYDCTDINVLTEPSIDIWGGPAPASGAGFDKVDHCLYTPGLKDFRTFDNECYAIGQGDTMDVCGPACLGRSGEYDYCDGTIVSPIQLPNTVKFTGSFANTPSHLPASCNNAIKNVADPSTMSVCYNFRAGETPIVGPAYKIVTDPEDPVFYSTCYMKRAAWQFKQSCPTCIPPPPPADFRFGDRCITCKDMNRNYFSKAAPFWKLSDICEDCDPSRG